MRWPPSPIPRAARSWTCSATVTGPANTRGFAAGWHHKLELLADTLEGEEPEWRDERFEELLAAYAQTLP